MSTVIADTVQNATNGQPLILKNVPTGFVVSSTVIREDRTIQVGSGYNNNAFSSAPSYIWGGEFTKYRDDTNLLVTLTTFGVGYYEGNCPIGVCLNKTEWDHGAGYQYDGNWSSSSQTTIVTGTHYFSSAQCKSGRHRLDFGVNTYNNVATGYFFAWVLNGVANISVNGTATDARLPGVISTMHVYELAP